MSAAVQFYLAGVLISAGVTIIACWGLDLQLGTTGILNFGFIVFQAAGAYTAAVLTMGPSADNPGQLYVGGARLPFLVALLCAGLVGGLVALPVGILGLRRLRSDYQAIVLLVVAVIATDIAENAGKLVNGAAGLSGVPQPFATSLHLTGTTYLWFYCLVVFAVAALVWLALRRLTSAPLGRTLRAIRENELAAGALGKNVNALRLFVFVAGGVIAGLSGGLYVGYLSAWAPSGWLYAESFVFVTAIIVGGRGNSLGVLIGAVIVPAFGEVSQFLPGFANPQFTGAIQWIFVGVVLLAFLWWRPRGIVPERRRVIDVRKLPFSGGTSGEGRNSSAGTTELEGDASRRLGEGRSEQGPRMAR